MSRNMTNPLGSAEPNLWLSMLRYVHERRSSYEPMEYILMCTTVKETSPAAWRRLLGAGFCENVIHCVADEYFCGFSREELTSSKPRLATSTSVSWFLQR